MRIRIKVVPRPLTAAGYIVDLMLEGTGFGKPIQKRVSLEFDPSAWDKLSTAINQFNEQHLQEE